MKLEKNDWLLLPVRQDGSGRVLVGEVGCKREGGVWRSGSLRVGNFAVGSKRRHIIYGHLSNPSRLSEAEESFIKI